jgi:hypothetical protein
MGRCRYDGGLAMSMDPFIAVFWDAKKKKNRIFKIFERVERTPEQFGPFFVAEELGAHGWVEVKDVHHSTIEAALEILQDNTQE